jgi:hypothetical protein
MTTETLEKPKIRTAKGRYLYCFIALEDSAMEFDIDPVPAPDGREVGEIYTVISGKVAAVVSNSPVMRYPISRPHLIAHEAVIKYIVRNATMPVLPVKYGTVASSEADLLNRLLLPQQTHLTGLIEELQGKVEITVKAMWQKEQIFAEVIKLPEIAALQAKIAAKPEAQAYQDKIELGQMVERALNAARERDAQLILERLTPLAHRHKLHTISLDMLVVNASLLISADQESEIDAAIEELDRSTGERLKIRYSSPLPPSSFVDFNLETAGV